MELAERRAAIAIVPQEPFMFSGSVRENLDPLNEHSDERLQGLIVDVGLDQQVRLFALYPHAAMLRARWVGVQRLSSGC